MYIIYIMIWLDINLGDSIWTQVISLWPYFLIWINFTNLSLKFQIITFTSPIIFKIILNSFTFKTIINIFIKNIFLVKITKLPLRLGLSYFFFLNTPIKINKNSLFFQNYLICSIILQNGVFYKQNDIFYSF